MTTGAFKVRVKTWLLAKLHARPEITSRIATRVLRDGVPRYLAWTYAAEKNATLRYLERLRAGNFGYKFALSSSEATLYGSVYACLLLGMHGELDAADPEFKNAWLDHLDRFQDPADGYFRDPLLAGPAFEGLGGWGDGWGIRHLAAHAVIAYARLGRSPRHAFKFLEPYYEQRCLQEWLGRIDFAANVWSQGNYVMNVYSLLQYARDYMGERRAAPAVTIIKQWLLAKQRQDTGMWHDYAARSYPELGDAIRGAYHFYPVFAYEDEPLRHTEAIVDTILRSQNSWGAFNPEECPSGACEDIDAIDPLVRAATQSGHRRESVDLALRRAKAWILSCRNGDGGYECIPEHGWSYGSHPLTSSRPGESNLFATWFRTLCLAYVVDYLGAPHSFQLGRYPGYEISVRR